MKASAQPLRNPASLPIGETPSAFKGMGLRLIFGAAGALMPLVGGAQSATDMAALRGLSPVSVLGNTAEGKAALTANYQVTGGIETGQLAQPTLLPFEEQRQQALRDAFITGDNLSQLSDGLGTTLGSAYLARVHSIDRRHSTKPPEAVLAVIATAQRVSGGHSGAGKYFFANATTNGKTAVSQEAADLLKGIGGQTDVFGRAYGLAAGSTGADPYGNSRPFQTEKGFARYSGFDFFHLPTTNYDAVRGLADSPSYPSGHTTYGYTGALTLALLVPERYQQMIARGAEYGNDRILVGAHYAMDVLGGRTLAMVDMAHLLANDPAYMSASSKSTAGGDFRAAMIAAQKQLRKTLEETCGEEVATGAAEDTGRFCNAVANEAFYACTQTYGLPVVYPKAAGTVEDVARVAPEAGYLLTVAFPSLSLADADRILTETEGPGGGFLDDGSAFGVYSRLNLYAAAGAAARLAKGKETAVRERDSLRPPTPTSGPAIRTRNGR